MWIGWVLGGLLTWLVVALALGVLIGRGVRLADRREGVGSDFVISGNVVAGASLPAREPRRPIPLPPIGIALAALAVALETGGYLARLRGLRLAAISMDAPLSVPRLYVATLFVFAAVVAFAAAGVNPGRRTWWAAVGLVAAAIATIKAGGTLHATALHALVVAFGEPAAQVISAAVALGVIGTLWYLSRTERRDRRRVLGSLAGYAFAAVVLSAISGAVGPNWAATATFLEESGEALGGVAFLIAVLAGTVPQAVLPAGWPLRRATDAQTGELAEHLRPGGLPG